MESRTNGGALQALRDRSRQGQEGAGKEMEKVEELGEPAGSKPGSQNRERSRRYKTKKKERPGHSGR